MKLHQIHFNDQSQVFEISLIVFNPKKHKKILQNPFYCIVSMNSNQQLVDALTQIAQIITKSDEYDPFLLAKQLLLNVNAQQFQQLFDRFGYRNFHSLQKATETYYFKKRCERIKWDCDVLLGLEDQFVKIAVFIFDLALGIKKEVYIQGILSLPQNLQLALQPFVEMVTNRQQYLQSASQNQDSENRDKIIEQLTEEYEKARNQKQYYLKKYEELKQNYDYLKSNHEKTAEEINYLRQERYSFINDLGGNQCGSVEETIQKVKQQLYNHEKNVQKFQRELQEKKGALKKKEEQLAEVMQNYKANNFQQKTRELEKTKKILLELQEDLSRRRTREQELIRQLESSIQYGKSKQQQCHKLQHSVASLQAYGSKYQKIRKLHNHFKSKLVKEMKELNQ